MTQKELSEKTGIRQSTISDWKNKKMNPSSDKIMIICEVLDVSPYEILSGTDEKYKPTEYVVFKKDSEEAMLIDSYRKLSKDSQNRLLGYMEAIGEVSKSTP